MLVLSRKKNQSIVINDDIEVFVVDVVNDQVKICIRAPQNVTIHRKEVYDNIKNEMAQAALSPERVKGLDKIRLPAQPAPASPKAGEAKTPPATSPGLVSPASTPLQPGGGSTSPAPGKSDTTPQGSN